MAGTNVLKEFLVSIGFKTDEQGFRNFTETMRKTGAGATELAKSTLGATVIMGGAMKVVAAQMEALYYASQRTGAGVGELKAFAFAASQIGVSAEQAQSAIEGLAAARRTNPGLNGILSGMGIDPRQADNAKVMVQLLTKLHSMPYFQGAQIAGMFGLNEQTFNMLEAGLPQMQKYLALREKMFSRAGVDPGDMAAKGHEFQTQLRTFEAGLGNLAEIIEYRLMPAGEKVIGWLQQVVDWATRADKATSGLSSKILGIGSGLVGMGIFKGVAGRVLGGAAAGEAAGGAGILGSLVSIPAIVAATLAYVASSQSGADGIRKLLGLPEKITAEMLKPSNVWHEVAKVAFATVMPVVEAAKKSSVFGSLEQMVQKSEGFAAKMYADHRGFSVGFGHLVKPGEDFSKGIDKGGALALLAKDLQAAMASVTSLVKVHLNQNQINALTDFVYNLGSGNLAKSTLLKKLNAGDFAGAADQFQYWNKALVNGHYASIQGLSDRRSAEAGLFRSREGVTITQKTDIHVNDSGTGNNVARQQDRVNGDLVRNMVGATR